MIDYRDDLPDRQEPDHLGRLAANASSIPGVTAVELGNGKKLGKASASIYRTTGSVLVEHDGRGLTLTTMVPAEVAEKVKKMWRKGKGPTIKIKS